MCCDERNTESRGLPFAACTTRWRTRFSRRMNRSLDFSDMAGLLLLAFLAADRFGLVLDAFALIGFGLAEFADLRRDLADALLVGAGDSDRGRLFAHDLDVVRDREIDVVAEAELKHQVLALDLRAIADAVYLEIDRVAVGDALHHVIDQRARSAPLHPRLLGFAACRHRDAAVRNLGLDLRAERHLERAELALRGQLLPRDRDLDALRNSNRIFADA